MDSTKILIGETNMFCFSDIRKLAFCAVSAIYIYGGLESSVYADEAAVIYDRRTVVNDGDIQTITQFVPGPDGPAQIEGETCAVNPNGTLAGGACCYNDATNECSSLGQNSDECALPANLETQGLCDAGCDYQGAVVKIIVKDSAVPMPQFQPYIVDNCLIMGGTIGPSNTCVIKCTEAGSPIKEKEDGILAQDGVGNSPFLRWTGPCAEGSGGNTCILTCPETGDTKEVTALFGIDPPPPTPTPTITPRPTATATPPSCLCAFPNGCGSRSQRLQQGRCDRDARGNPLVNCDDPMHRMPECDPPPPTPTRTPPRPTTTPRPTGTGTPPRPTPTRTPTPRPTVTPTATPPINSN